MGSTVTISQSVAINPLCCACKFSSRVQVARDNQVEKRPKHSDPPPRLDVLVSLCQEMREEKG